MGDGPDLSDGDAIVGALAALANPHRMRIVAALVEGGGRVHVSLLARQVGLARTLVHMHLQRLEAAGLVRGHLEVSAEGRALKLFTVTPFALTLTPETVAAAAQTLTTEQQEGS